MSGPIITATDVSKVFLQMKSPPTLLRWLGIFAGMEFGMRKFCALQNLTVSIERGSRVALLGKNGAGKTTLLRILAGIFAPSSGQLLVAEKPTTLLRLYTGVVFNLSVEENIYLLGLVFGAEESIIKGILPEILDFAELNEFREFPVKDLSAGQAQRIAISVFLFTCGSFLIFDESFTYLDAEFSKKCERYLDQMKSPSRTMILSSHDSQFLARHCTHALFLEHGEVKGFGPFEEINGIFNA